MESKACFRCGEVKTLSEFYKHPRMSDGHLGKCKECTKADVLKNRDENLDRIREYDRKRGARRTPEAIRKWYDNGGKEKKRAHTILNRAIKSGNMVRKPCEVCGTTDRIHAHHDDYRKALEVRWLCVKHHRQHHTGRRID